MNKGKYLGYISKYFRTKHYGFVELYGEEHRKEFKDIFFHLDRIPANINENELVKGTPVTVTLCEVNKGWAVEHMELGDNIDYSLSNATTLLATPETDALLKQQTFNEGRDAKRKGHESSDCPHDPNSLIGKWWFEGFKSTI